MKNNKNKLLEHDKALHLSSAILRQRAYQERFSLEAAHIDPIKALLGSNVNRFSLALLRNYKSDAGRS